MTVLMASATDNNTEVGHLKVYDVLGRLEGMERKGTVSIRDEAVPAMVRGDPRELLNGHGDVPTADHTRREEIKRTAGAKH